MGKKMKQIKSNTLIAKLHALDKPLAQAFKLLDRLLSHDTLDGFMAFDKETNHAMELVVSGAQVVMDRANSLKRACEQAWALSHMLKEPYYAVCRCSTSSYDGIEDGPGLWFGYSDRTSFRSSSLPFIVAEYDRLRHSEDYYRANPRNRMDKVRNNTYFILMLTPDGELRRLTEPEIEIGRQMYEKQFRHLPVPDWNGQPCGIRRPLTEEESEFKRSSQAVAPSCE